MLDIQMLHIFQQRGLLGYEFRFNTHYGIVLKSLTSKHTQVTGNLQNLVIHFFSHMNFTANNVALLNTE